MAGADLMDCPLYPGFLRLATPRIYKDRVITRPFLLPLKSTTRDERFAYIQVPGWAHVLPLMRQMTGDVKVQRSLSRTVPNDSAPQVSQAGDS
jgi:hypothetical protein